MKKDMNRLYPNLYCAGAVKSGTSTLYAVLKQHPDIYFSYKKEIMYYNVHKDRGDEWYSDFFREAGDYRYRCDFTPRYYSIPDFPKEVMRVSGPDTKFIFMFRNPADRIYSQYSMWKIHGHETGCTIPEMVAGMESGDPPDRHVLISQSFYHMHLSRLLELYPLENMHIIIFEDFIKDVRGEVLKLFDFLGLEEPEDIDYEQWKNKAVAKDSRLKAFLYKKVFLSRWLGIKDLFPMKLKYKTRNLLYGGLVSSYGNKVTKDPEMCRRLIDIYREDIGKLSVLLSRDLSFWIDKYKEVDDV